MKQSSTDEQTEDTTHFRPAWELIEQTTGPLRDEESGSSDLDIPDKTFRDLEWGELISLLEEETMTPEGKQLSTNLPPLKQRDAVERRLDEISEMDKLLEDDQKPPISGLYDIREAITFATKDRALVVEDLEAIARNCEITARCQRFFENRREKAPRMAATADQLSLCDELRKALRHAVEPGGRLSDHASPDLAKLRRSVQNHHDRLRSRIEQFLNSDRVEVHLQDDYYTIRDDRYVVPVQAGNQSEIPGIVHGYSSSGETAFIEPQAFVDLNNQLRWAETELEQEKERIRERLSGLVADCASQLRRNTKLLAYIDIVTAAARFGRKTKCHVPEISDQDMNLKQLKHPLLFMKTAREIDGEVVSDAVENDVWMEEDSHVLVISGPNTGGKTVLLKAVGLAALLTRFGLPIPADEGSRIPLFDSVFSDVGDEQSIELDLSTFSAHLTNITQFLNRCEESSLVLLDELFTGTDPHQGAALATALLRDLASRGSKTIVTTHLEKLKTLAIEEDDFSNASMGFDIDTLSPTYELTLGFPGNSFAIRIASQLGFPEHLVEKATDIIESEEHQDVNEVISSLEEQIDDLEREKSRLQEERNRAKETEQKYKDKLKELRTEEEQMVHEETQRLKEQLKEARRLVKDKIKEIQQAQQVEDQSQISHSQLTDIQQELEGAEETLEKSDETINPPEPNDEGLVPIAAENIEVDLELFVRPFGRKGEVVDIERDNEEATLQLGPMKADVAFDELFYPSEAARRSHRRGTATSDDSKSSMQQNNASEPEQENSSPDGAIPQSEDNTLDLRGLRVEEALDRLESFLDSQFLGSQNGVHIIHGHGTGALKRAVRGRCMDSPYVHDFRPGDPEEGGDGVTVITLAETIEH
jgi:DNA mismatch repair protein MutS2